MTVKTGRLPPVIRLRLRAAWLGLTAKSSAIIAVSADSDGVPSRVRGVLVFPGDSRGLFGAAALGATGMIEVLDLIAKDEPGAFDVRLTAPDEHVAEKGAVD